LLLERQFQNSASQNSAVQRKAIRAEIRPFHRPGVPRHFRYVYARRSRRYRFNVDLNVAGGGTITGTVDLDFTDLALSTGDLTFSDKGQSSVDFDGGVGATSTTNSPATTSLEFISGPVNELVITLPGIEAELASRLQRQHLQRVRLRLRLIRLRRADKRQRPQPERHI
jgi:hypothetical protein